MNASSHDYSEVLLAEGALDHIKTSNAHAHLTFVLTPYHRATCLHSSVLST